MGEALTRLAVLIDAENVPRSILPKLMEEIGKHGRATVKRAYANWASPGYSTWRDDLHRHGFQPVHFFSCAKGKNAADSALIVDAMDLLYAGNLKGFCIVSSDSDFTPLCARLRQSGLMVYGFGNQMAPASLRAACDKFTLIENLVPKPVNTAKGASAPIAESKTLSSEVGKLLIRGIEATAGAGGWVAVNRVHGQIKVYDEKFKPETHGHKSLVKLFESSSIFEVERRASNHPFVRVKPRS